MLKYEEKNLQYRDFLLKHQGETEVNMRYIEANFYTANMRFIDMKVKQNSKYCLKKCSQLLYDTTKSGCKVPINTRDSKVLLSTPHTDTTNKWTDKRETIPYKTPQVIEEGQEVIDNYRDNTGMIIFEMEEQGLKILDMRNCFLKYKNKMHKPLICEQRQEHLYFSEVRYDTIDKQMIDIPEKNKIFLITAKMKIKTYRLWIQWLALKLSWMKTQESVSSASSQGHKKL